MCSDNLTAAILGGIAVVATPKWRMQMAAVNIQECLGVDQARAQQIAEKSLRRFGRMVVEVMRFPLLNKDNITKLVNVEGLEYLEEAYKQNKGVIIASSYFTVVGVTKPLGGMMAFSDPERTVVIPALLVQQMYGLGRTIDMLALTGYADALMGSSVNITERTKGEKR